MKILLVRHGKTQGNLEGRYVGRTDEPILKEEWQRLSSSEFQDFFPQVVYTSELLRCRQTAEVLFGKGDPISEQKLSDDGVRYIICAGLNETDFGEFEYKNYGELNGNPVYQAWIDSGGMLAFPGGESGADFRKRCQRAFCECVEDARGRQADRVAFVVHGGTIMSIMEHFARPGKNFYDWQVKNGQGFLTEMQEDENGNPYLICWGSDVEKGKGE